MDGAVAIHSMGGTWISIDGLVTQGIRGKVKWSYAETGRESVKSVVTSEVSIITEKGSLELQVGCSSPEVALLPP